MRILEQIKAIVAVAKSRAPQKIDKHMLRPGLEKRAIEKLPLNFSRDHWMRSLGRFDKAAIKAITGADAKAPYKLFLRVHDVDAKQRFGPLHIPTLLGIYEAHRRSIDDWPEGLTHNDRFEYAWDKVGHFCFHPPIGSDGDKTTHTYTHVGVRGQLIKIQSDTAYKATCFICGNFSLWGAVIAGPVNRRSRILVRYVINESVLKSMLKQIEFGQAKSEIEGELDKNGDGGRGESAFAIGGGPQSLASEAGGAADAISSAHSCSSAMASSSSMVQVDQGVGQRAAKKGALVITILGARVASFSEPSKKKAIAFESLKNQAGT